MNCDSVLIWETVLKLFLLSHVNTFPMAMPVRLCHYEVNSKSLRFDHVILTFEFASKVMYVHKGL